MSFPTSPQAGWSEEFFMEQKGLSWLDKLVIIIVYGGCLLAFMLLPAHAQAPEYEVSITFCDNSGACHEQKWPLEESVMPTKCFMYVQPLAADYIASHYGQTIRTFGCGKRRYSL